VVQRHEAKRAGLHYDFRLELPTDGEKVFVSWAVRKGLSESPGVKRLGIRTDDHDVKWGTFEGIIEDDYGAGKVTIWDSGRYKMLSPIKNVAELNRARVFEVELFGKKIKGKYRFIKTKKGWLIERIGDEDDK